VGWGPGGFIPTGRGGACRPAETRLEHQSAKLIGVLGARPASAAAQSPTLSEQEQSYLQRARDGNHAELLLGQLGQARASTDELKQTASKMVEKHSALERQLRDLARERGMASDPTVSPETKANDDHLATLTGKAFDNAFKQAVTDAHARELSLQKGELATGVDPALRSFAGSRVTALEQNPTPFMSSEPAQKPERGW
jgi:putative membrane protein